MEQNLNNQTPPPPVHDVSPSQNNTTVVPEKSKRKLPLAKILVAGIVILITVFAFGLIAYLMMGEKKTEDLNQVAVTEVKAPSPTPIPEEKDLITETEENVMTYYSPSLGITFNFIKSENGKELYLNRKQNKVCITYDDPNDTNCEKGQFVEVFSKSPAETLTQAIERQFLEGFDKKDCYVDEVYSNIIINYPDSPNPEIDPWENAKKCPSRYSKTNGLRYFYEDENFPEKYAFFSIGQYAIPAGPTINDSPWQSTFKFTDQANSADETNVNTSDWKTYINNDFGYSIIYPKTIEGFESEWEYLEFNDNFGNANSVGFRPKEIREDVLWAINVYTNRSVEEVIADIGDQFSDRKENRETITIDGKNALLVNVTTNEVPTWTAKNIIITNGNRIYSISNGAQNESEYGYYEFDKFYNSFQFN